MPYAVKKVEIWAGDIANQPGTLARVLEALAQAGANLEFMIAREVSDTTSRVYVAPLGSKKQKQAATDVGLVPAAGMHSVRIEGPDRAGLGAAISRGLAAAGLNIRGASAGALAKKSVSYFAFKSDEEASAAIKAIRSAVAAPKKAAKKGRK